MVSSLERVTEAAKEHLMVLPSASRTALQTGEAKAPRTVPAKGWGEERLKGVVMGQQWAGRLAAEWVIRLGSAMVPGTALE